MKGILKLVLCSIRYDKKTFRMISGVTLSVISFILCSNIIMSGNEFTRLLEIQENGSYQVRFFDVSKEQAEQIKEQEEVLNCIWVQEREVSYAEVELAPTDFCARTLNSLASFQTGALLYGLLPKVPQGFKIHHTKIIGGEVQSHKDGVFPFCL